MVSLRLLLIPAVIALVVLSAALNVAARENAVGIKHVYIENSVDTVVFATIEASRNFRDSRVAVFVQELGIWEDLEVDLSDSRGRVVQIGIPTPEMLDSYITVMVTTADGHRDVKHVPFFSN